MTQLRKYRLLGTMLALCVMSGCAVPSSGDSTRIEEVPGDGSDDSVADLPGVLTPTGDAEDTVIHFLGAAAGDWANRNERLDKFVGAAKIKWSDPDVGMPLVRVNPEKVTALSSSSATKTEVKVSGTIVGLYNQNGQVKKPSGDPTYEETFVLRRDLQTEAWHITSPPAQVVISASEFADRYDPRPLYFPAASDASDTLVPDLRWVPRSLQAEKAMYERLAAWLISGPSEWLESSVTSGIPSGAALETVSIDDDQVTVDISRESASSEIKEYDAISAQLAWTLGLHDDQTLRLLVSGREEMTSSVSEWADHNRAPPDDPNNRELIYFISEGVVQAADSSAPFDGTEYKGGIQEAALEPGGSRIAAVVGSGSSDGLVVGRRGDLTAVPDVAAGELTDPQWLDRETLLVLADGKPTAVRISSGESVEVSMSTIDAEITEISLAPDSRRLAYVAGERAYVAPLAFTDELVVKLGEPQRVGLSVTRVRDIGWSQETRVLMIGEVPDAEEWMWEVSIDNAFQKHMEGTRASSTGQVADALAVRCNPPKGTPDVGQPVVVELGDNIMRVFNASGVDQIGNEDHVGEHPFVAG